MIPAWADIHAIGFWGRRQGVFFGIRVFHPNSPSYRYTQIGSLFHRHELEKKRQYGDRVSNVEFGLLVFSTLGREATIFNSRLADLLAGKHNTTYTHMNVLYHLFSLLRSAILAILG